MRNSAIIIVDMLYDFIDGSLACLNADEAVRNCRDFLHRTVSVDDFDENGIADTIPVMFVCDHHPADHCSFRENGGIWPVHCVAGTRGAQIHEDLLPYVNEDLIFYKGCDSNCEQYSGFEGKSAADQTMDEILGLLGISDVYICGIATEYCVNNTATDLKKAGYKVHILKDTLAYVEKEGHIRTLAQMAESGVEIQ